MATSQVKEVFLPRRGKNVTTLKSTQVVRSTVAKTWRWMRPDFFMRIVPMTFAPFLYIAIFRPPLSSLGLTADNIPQQILIGLLVGCITAAFAATYRMYLVGPWFRRPTFYDHLFQAFYYLC